MPKPNGDNPLTVDKLRLRDVRESATPADEPNDFEITIKLRGPGFVELNVTAKGPPWIVRKLLQDLDASVDQIW